MINGWLNKKVKDICIVGRGRVISQKEIDENPGIYPVYSSQSFNQGEMGKIGTYDFVGEYVTWTTDGAYAGTVFHRDGKFNCTNVCGTLKEKNSEELDLKFLSYKLATVTKKHVSYVGNPKLMNTVVSEISIDLPKLKSEQIRIAEILNTADEAIEETEKLIAKYQRIKTGLMQDLLTRGIDEHGNIRSKATHKFVVKKGIEVPEEWDVISIQDFASKKKYAIVDGPFGSNLKIIHYRSSGVPVIQSGFVTANKFVAKEYLFVDKEKLEQEIRSKVEPGDIVMAKIGANCGTCAILPDDHPISIIAGNCLKITVGDNNSNRYLEILLHFLYDYRKFDDIKSTTAQPAISMAQLKEYKIAQPSKDEQLKIVNILDSIDETIADTNENLSKIISIKTGLMQDLLSGRVRVKVKEN